MTDGCYTLYGAQVSLYSSKVRSYLLYKGVDFQEVTATRKIYSTVILPQTGIRFIPVVRMPITEFGQLVVPGWPGFLQRFVGAQLASRFKGFVPKLGITAKTIPAIEEWYENNFLVALDRHFVTHKYLLGDAASIGDFGLMGPLYAHLYRDPRSGEIMHRLAPHVVQWIERMNSRPAAAAVVGSTWLPNDDIPETLTPILKRMFDEFFPVLKSTIQVMAEWKDAHPVGSAIPRVVGTHAFQIGDAHEERVVASFHQWKLQRVLEIYQGFTEIEKQQVDDWFVDAVGSEAKSLMSIDIPEPVTRQNNKLVWVTGHSRL